jgi:hypothetical protein
MFRVGQKVTPKNDEAWEVIRGDARRRKPDVDPVFGEVYTIRDMETDTEGYWLRFVEIQNRATRYADEAQYDADDFRPVVDISDMQAIVREQMLGKPRTIAPDKFDKQRIHSATPRADASAPSPSRLAAAGSPPKESAAPNSRPGAASCRRVSPDALAMPPRLERETPDEAVV